MGEDEQFAFDDKIVDALLGLGLASKNACVRAVLATDSKGVNQAAEWLLNHQNDDGINHQVDVLGFVISESLAVVCCCVVFRCDALFICCFSYFSQFLVFSPIYSHFFSFQRSVWKIIGCLSLCSYHPLISN